MMAEEQRDDVEADDEDISLTKSELDEIIDSSTIISERGSSAAETDHNDDPNDDHDHKESTDAAVMEDIVSLDMDAHSENAPDKDTIVGIQAAQSDEQLDTSAHDEVAEMASLDDDINRSAAIDLGVANLGAENSSADEELAAPFEEDAADVSPASDAPVSTKPAKASAKDLNTPDKMATLESPPAEDSEPSLDNEDADAMSDSLPAMMVGKETVALSGNELDNLIENLDKSGGNIEVSASNQSTHTASSPPTAKLAEPTLILSQEFKDLFKHLDDLMTHLPKEKVEVFAHSKHFKKYTQIINAISKP